MSQQVQKFFAWGLPTVCGLAIVGCTAAKFPSQAILSPPAAQAVAVEVASPGPAGPVAAVALRPTFTATERLAGFSSNGQHYLYLEASRDTGAGIPKATLQVLHLPTNTCTTAACMETRYREGDAGTSIATAAANLLQQTQALRQQLKLTQPVMGQGLPIVERTRSAEGTESVTLQLDGQPLQLRLRQQAIAEVADGEASTPAQAAMQLEVTYQGQTRVLDSLNNYRDWVLDYSIRQVQRSPDGNQLAILITMTQPTFEGTLGTTLVQGLTL